MVRCLFRVTEKTELEQYGSAENKKFRFKLVPMMSEGFGKYTPWGIMEFMVENDSASEQLIVGKQYYLDIHPTEEVTTK